MAIVCDEYSMESIELILNLRVFLMNNVEYPILALDHRENQSINNEDLQANKIWLISDAKDKK